MADPTIPVSVPGSTVAPVNRGEAAPVNKGELFTSFDVEAFEVPSSREEAWRFTPFRRLRGLHDGSATADGQATVSVTGAGDGVTVETVGRDDKRLGQGGVPFDRIAAQAYSSFTEATVITVAREVEVGEPIVITLEGPGVDKTAFGHVQIRSSPSRVRSSSSTRRAAEPTRRTSNSSSTTRQR